jgi:hypothetical protein
VTNTGYTYDNAGNLTADGTYTYTWDAESHLTSVNGVNYAYDSDVRRVKKSSGVLCWYSTDGQIPQETDLSGNVQNDYAYFAGKRMTRKESSGNVFFYFTDPLGTTRLITQNGTVCYDADYYPSGGDRVVTNTCAQSARLVFQILRLFPLPLPMPRLQNAEAGSVALFVKAAVFFGPGLRAAELARISHQFFGPDR